MMKVVIVNAFDTYEHRVELLYNYFKRYHCDIQVYASDFQHIKKEYRNTKKKDYVFIHTEAYYRNLSVNRLQSHKKFSESVYRKIKSMNIDLLWILVPPNSLVSMAAQYKKYHSNTKLIFDLIDLWPETMPISRFKNIPPLLWWKNMRDKNLKYADFIVTECDLYQEKLKHFINKEKLRTLYLAREVNLFSEEIKLPKDKISLCYLGSINNIIDIDAIQRIIVELKKQRPVELNIIGDGEKREKFITRIKKIGVNVIYHGKIYSEDEKKKIFSKCHFGLNIMKDSVYVGLTMKSIDYFEAGLPIINNIKGDTWNLVEKYNLGFNISNLKNIRIDTYKKEMRKNVRCFFEKKLSIDYFDNELKKILKNI